ncbi:MAG TPA: hypothetical protein VFE63_16615 [Roseiarcus sp.]|nr:hypothetical protein [Roseiarcus sp.]
MATEGRVQVFQAGAEVAVHAIRAAARARPAGVQNDCCVEVDGNFYSVPWRLIGERTRVSERLCK